MDNLVSEIFASLPIRTIFAFHFVIRPNITKPFKKNATLTSNYDNQPKSITKVKVIETIQIPPFSETVVLAAVHDSTLLHWEGLFDASPLLPSKYSFFAARGLVQVSDNQTVPVRLLNPNPTPVKVYEH